MLYEYSWHLSIKIHIFDTDRDKKIKTIYVDPDAAAYALASSPDGGRVYAAGYDYLNKSGKLFTINTTTDTIDQKVDAEAYLDAVAVNPRADIKEIYALQNGMECSFFQVRDSERLKVKIKWLSDYLNKRRKTPSPQMVNMSTWLIGKTPMW